VFPVLSLPLIDADPFAAGVLLARNVMVGGLFLWSLVALWRAGTAPQTGRDALRMPVAIAAVARG